MNNDVCCTKLQQDIDNNEKACQGEVTKETRMGMAMLMAYIQSGRCPHCGTKRKVDQ